jgi:chorismate mutase
MNEINEKYLARMLEGAEQGLKQVDQQIDQLNTQLTAMTDQREEMVTAAAELRELLGVEEETPETVS